MASEGATSAEAMFVVAVGLLSIDSDVNGVECDLTHTRYTAPPLDPGKLYSHRRRAHNVRNLALNAAHKI